MKRVFLSLVLLVIVSGSSVFGETLKVKDINIQRLNSVVTIKGSVVNVIPPGENSNYYVIYAFDDSDSIRVIIPTEIMANLKARQKELIGKNGEFTGEVKTILTYFEIRVKSASDIIFEGEKKENLVQQPSAAQQIPQQPAGQPVQQAQSAPPAVQQQAAPANQIQQAQPQQQSNMFVQHSQQTQQTQQTQNTQPVQQLQQAQPIQQVQAQQPVQQMNQSAQQPAIQPVQQAQIQQPVQGQQVNQVQQQMPPAQSQAQFQQQPAAQPVQQSQSAQQAVQPVQYITDFKNITKDYEGKNFGVIGTITTFKESWKVTAPNILTITDGTANFNVVFWPNIGKDIIPPVKVTGTKVSAYGLGDVYRDQLQLKIENAGNLKVFDGNTTMVPLAQSPASLTQSQPAQPQAQSHQTQLQAPPQAAQQQTIQPQTQQIQQAPAQQGQPNASLQKIPLNQVSETMKDQVVTVEGTVAEFKASWSETAPNKIKLTGEGATVVIVYWKDVSDKLARVPTLGEKLTATGKVSMHLTEVQIKVNDPASLIFTGLPSPPVTKTDKTFSNVTAPADNTNSAAQTAPNTVTSASQITQASVNSIVTVQGQVVNFKAPSKDTAPYNIEVQDSTGKIMVVFWKDVADSLSSGNIPAQGKNVKVTGKVNAFKGSLQLKVSKASDIQITN